MVGAEPQDTLLTAMRNLAFESNTMRVIFVFEETNYDEHAELAGDCVLCSKAFLVGKSESTLASDI